MPPVTFSARVEQIENLSYNVRGFRLKLTEPTEMPFEAGQFIIINVPKDGKTFKRAYSIASAPFESGMLELCVQKAEGGIASTYFWKLKEGDTVSLSGAHGRFLLKEPKNYEPVFMCTGTGVAPLRSMIKQLLRNNFSSNMWLFFGTRYEHSLLYESEFRSLATMRHNFHYVPTVSRPKDWYGETGHIQQTFQKKITDFSNKEIYICGWLKIVRAIAKDLESFGVPKEKIHYEEWA